MDHNSGAGRSSHSVSSLLLTENLSRNTTCKRNKERDILVWGFFFSRLQGPGEKINEPSNVRRNAFAS